MKKEDVEVLLRDYLSGYLKIRKTVTDDSKTKFQFDVIDLFMKNLKKVDEVNYRILVMFYYSNQTWKVIASELSLSAKACQSRRDRMINELRRMLRK